MKLEQTNTKRTHIWGKWFQKKKGLTFIALIGILIGLGCVAPYQTASDIETPAGLQLGKNIVETIQKTSIQASAYVAEQKAAEEKALAEQKAAEEKALAEAKAAEEAKILAEQKAAEERAIAEAKAAEEAKAAVPATIPITTRAADDPYADDKEVVATISIPDVGIYQPVIHGDSQENIDNYEVVLRRYHHFGQRGPILMAGHNYKTFSKLGGLSVGSKIYIHSYYGDFTYTVHDIQIGTTDGWNIVNDNGEEIINYFSPEQKLHMYTCHGNDPNRRLIVTAHPD